MEQQRIDPTTSLSVTMKAAEWEAMLQVLQKAPYEQVVGAIQAIIAQCTSASRMSES